MIVWNNKLRNGNDIAAGLELRTKRWSGRGFDTCRPDIAIKNWGIRI